MGRGSTEFRAAAAVAVALATSLLLTYPSAAQENTTPGEPAESPTCTVFAGSVADDPREVRARCWGIVVSLGFADSFRAFDNLELRSTVVELEGSGKRRVLLLRPFVDDRPLVEDISGTLAVAAGRFSWTGVDGLALDFEQFGANGRIGIVPEVMVTTPPGEGGASAGDGSSAEPIEVRIDQYIARDEAVMAAAQMPVTEAN